MSPTIYTMYDRSSANPVFLVEGKRNGHVVPLYHLGDYGRIERMQWTSFTPYAERGLVDFDDLDDALAHAVEYASGERP